MTFEMNKDLCKTRKLGRCFTKKVFTLCVQRRSAVSFLRLDSPTFVRVISLSLIFPVGAGTAATLSNRTAMKSKIKILHQAFVFLLEKEI